MKSKNIKLDIVIDTNIMYSYDRSKSPNIKQLYRWLKDIGTLAMSQFLLKEYLKYSNQNITYLIDHLKKHKRYDFYKNESIKSFNKDKAFKYKCNRKDIPHARLVFLTNRKKLITMDNKLMNDVNRFKLINGVKPCACNLPRDCCIIEI